MVINLIIYLLKNLLKLIRHLFWLGLWVFGLAILLWLPLRWWPGDRLRPVQMLNYFMPWLLVALTPALIMAATARRLKLMMVLAISTLAIALNFAPLFLPRLDVALAGNTSLQVMSYNLLYRNQNLTDALAIIRQEQPDILLLQEVTPEIAKTFQTLHDIYPDGPAHYAYDPPSGQATISRYPILQVEIAREKGRILKVQVDTPGGLINVWNVHPNTPHNWPRHYHQLTALAGDIAGVEGPLIVGGDFNTTYHSEVYRLINRQLSNAQWDAGWGFGFTFPANTPRIRAVPILTPVIRIDHIFHNDYFFAQRAETLASAGGSDHLPIVAEFSLVK